MRYLHTKVRVENLDAALRFYRDLLGLKVVSRVHAEYRAVVAARPVATP